MDKYQQLERLKELLDAGILTPEEFNDEKNQILNSEEMRGDCTTTTPHIDSEIQPTHPQPPQLQTSETKSKNEKKWDNMTEYEKVTNLSLGLGLGIGLLLVFLIIIPMVMLFGWNGLFAGFKNLIGG